jgi:hypothetical protein
MLAAVYRTQGSPDVVEVVEVDKPEPGLAEIRITVQAAALNPTDAMAWRGGFFPATAVQVSQPEPAQPGNQMHPNHRPVRPQGGRPQPDLKLRQPVLQPPLHRPPLRHRRRPRHLQDLGQPLLGVRQRQESTPAQPHLPTVRAGHVRVDIPATVPHPAAPRKLGTQLPAGLCRPAPAPRKHHSRAGSSHHDQHPPPARTGRPATTPAPYRPSTSPISSFRLVIKVAHSQQQRRTLDPKIQRLELRGLPPAGHVGHDRDPHVPHIAHNCSPGSSPTPTTTRCTHCGGWPPYAAHAAVSCAHCAGPTST